MTRTIIYTRDTPAPPPTNSQAVRANGFIFDAGSRVLDIAGMVHLSKATMGNIWQNLAVSLGLKAIFLVTTIIGVTGLWPAILADTGATVMVTLNAMRLLAWSPRLTARVRTH